MELTLKLLTKDNVLVTQTIKNEKPVNVSNQNFLENINEFLRKYIIQFRIDNGDIIKKIQIYDSSGNCISDTTFSED